MPLSKRHFELGIDDQVENYMHRVYNLLSGGKDLAYSFEELRQDVLGEGPGPGYVADRAERDKFDRALDVLVEISAVERRELGDTGYGDVPLGARKDCR